MSIIGSYRSLRVCCERLDHEWAREALLPPALGAVPVTTVTAHSLDYCFAVIAPSCGASCLSSEELRAADLAALFLYGKWLALTRLAQLEALAKLNGRVAAE